MGYIDDPFSHILKSGWVYDDSSTNKNINIIGKLHDGTPIRLEAALVGIPSDERRSKKVWRLFVHVPSSDILYTFTDNSIENDILERMITRYRNTYEIF